MERRFRKGKKSYGLCMRMTQKKDKNSKNGEEEGQKNLQICRKNKELEDLINFLCLFSQF